MWIILQGHVTEPCYKMINSFFQEIDELLSGSLTQEDEDAVLQELEEMTQVKCYTSWANKSIGIKTSIVSISGWRRRNFPPTPISPQYNAPGRGSAAKQTHARMWCIGVYTVGSCWCQHCIFNVAECNLGNSQGWPWVFHRGIWVFMAILLMSSHFACVTCCDTLCVYFCSLPGPPFGKYWVSIII